MSLISNLKYLMELERKDQNKFHKNQKNYFLERSLSIKSNLNGVEIILEFGGELVKSLWSGDTELQKIISESTIKNTDRMSSFGAKQVFSKAHIDYCKSQETPANVKMNGLYCHAA